jgi:xanthine dehydrogenase YagS FAD-binding subunit
MIPFDFARPSTPKAAIDAVAKDTKAKFIAGGTNLVDLMKRGVMAPEKILDINSLPLKSIQKEGNSIRIGALALNSAVAENELVVKHLPLLSQALKAGASPQIRNMATVGGNLMQRTRCPYFYDTTMPCNKRNPGSGCSALEGYNRMHAILGASPSCIAVNPSDMNVALAALGATVTVQGSKSVRQIPIGDFHRLPGTTPHLDNNLQRDELITGVQVPVIAPFAQRALYTKIRDRASYAFALVSVAVAMDYNAGGPINEVKIAMGGVAHKPWRLLKAESMLRGQMPTELLFQKAIVEELKEARGFGHNNFKVALSRNTLLQSLKTLTRLS